MAKWAVLLFEHAAPIGAALAAARKRTPHAMPELAATRLSQPACLAMPGTSALPGFAGFSLLRASGLRAALPRSLA